MGKQDKSLVADPLNAAATMLSVADLLYLASDISAAHPKVSRELDAIAREIEQRDKGQVREIAASSTSAHLTKH